MQQRWRGMQATLEGLQARVTLHLPEGAISSRCGSSPLSSVWAKLSSVWASSQDTACLGAQTRLHRCGGRSSGVCGTSVDARCCAREPHRMRGWQGPAACAAAAVSLALMLQLPSSCCTEGGSTGEVVSAAGTGSQQPLLGLKHPIMMPAARVVCSWRSRLGSGPPDHAVRGQVR